MIRLSLGSFHVSFWAPRAGWVGRGDGSGLGSLHVSFLGSLVGIGGPWRRTGLPFDSLHFMFYFLGSVGGPCFMFLAVAGFKGVAVPLGSDLYGKP